MAVYTSLSKPDLESFLKHYSVGELVSFEGIANGIENTNYFVDTTSGSYVLTIYEHFKKDDITFYLELVRHLNESRIPCVQACISNRDKILHELSNKPAALFIRLRGYHVDDATNRELESLGLTMAGMHSAASVFKQKPKTPDCPHFQAIYSLESPSIQLEPSDLRLYKEEKEYQQAVNRATLPCSYIHGDLFRDNCIMNNEKVVGVLDFYSASWDAMILDIAIAATDWCRDDINVLCNDKLGTFTQAYQRERQLTAEEKRLWPDMLRFAAFRFWCSRLFDAQIENTNALKTEKDPADYRKILIFLREHSEKIKL